MAARSRRPRPQAQPQAQPPGPEQPAESAPEAPVAEQAAEPGTVVPEAVGPPEPAPESPEAELPAGPVAAGPHTSIEFNADRTEKVLVDVFKSFRDKQGKEDAAAWIGRGILERDLFRAYQPSGPPPRHAAPVVLVESVRQPRPWMLPDRREVPSPPV